jgi:hypothetical protein
MVNQQNGGNQQQGRNIAENIKNTAGSAFEAVHNALETTEDVAMNTVDAAKNATQKMTGNNNNNQGNQR